MSGAEWMVRADGDEQAHGPYATRREAVAMSGFATPIAARETTADGYTYRSEGGSTVHIFRAITQDHTTSEGTK